MRDLKFCPRCHAKLNGSSDGKIKYCTICKYWTKLDPVRRSD